MMAGKFVLGDGTAPVPVKVTHIGQLAVGEKVTGCSGLVYRRVYDLVYGHVHRHVHVHVHTHVHTHVYRCAHTCVWKPCRQVRGVCHSGGIPSNGMLATMPGM